MVNFFKKYKKSIFVSSFSTVSINIKASNIVEAAKNLFSNVIQNNMELINIFTNISKYGDPRNIIFNVLGIKTEDENKIVEIFNNYLFPITNFNNVECDNDTGVFYKFYEKTDKNIVNRDTLIVCCHGITDNIENFSGVQKNISDIFGCDSISLEYNFFKKNNKNERLGLNKMKEMSQKLFEFLKEYLKKNSKYKKVIFYGYSHGNLYTINLFKLSVTSNDKTITYTCIGDKGYQNLSQALKIVIKSNINIDNGSNNFMKNLNELIKNITDSNALNYMIRYILGKNLYNTIIDQSDNLKTLKSIKNYINVHHNKLNTQGHSISEEGISEVFKFYLTIEKNKDGKFDCFLFSADNDEMVGDGFGKVNIFLTTGEEPEDINFDKEDNEIINNIKNINNNKVDDKGDVKNKNVKIEDEKEKKKLCCFF